MTDDVSVPSPFAVDGPLPNGLLALEASAGTGKTYALTAIAVRYIAERGLTAGGLCMVSFTESATAELRGRLRARLVETADALEAGSTLGGDPVVKAITSTALDPAELAARIRRLRLAVAEFDAATITTIHGFCARVLAAAGVGVADTAFALSGDDTAEAVNDLLLARRRRGPAPAGASDVDPEVARQLASDPIAEMKPSRVVEAVRTRIGIPDAVMERFPLLDTVTTPAHAADQRRRLAAVAAADLVDEACALVFERRHAARRRTVDGIITDTRDLLTSAAGAAHVSALRARYRLVLIDEFQDTDRVQWDIFRTAFVGGEDAPTMVLVGDPKQSIYRFRSAELSAYLDAVETADEVATLGTNWRSDAAVLAGLEQLFTKFRFGSDRVRFHQVDAAPDAQVRRIAGADQILSRAVEVRMVPLINGSLSAPQASAAVSADVVAVVADLLSAGAADEDRGVMVGPEGSRRPLRARDIAILTKSNSDASRMVAELARAGIPAATAASNSVLQSPAAVQWQLVLRALEHPGSSGAARAAALGWFVGISPKELAEFTDDDVAALHDRLRLWAMTLATRGIPQFLALARADGLHRRLLARSGGERDLTDLDHIAELLQTATGGRPMPAASLRSLLADSAGVSDDTASSDLLSRRIDRDDDAVQVLTVHRSKGLEFSVVLCPYLWRSGGGGSRVPHAFVEPIRRIDSSWVADVSNVKLNRQLRNLGTEEERDESHRALYVALTRAKHQCVLWWAPTTTGKASPMKSLLTAAFEPGAALDDLTSFDPLIEASAGSIGAVEIALQQPARVVQLGQRADALEVATAERRLDTAWRIWSFSSIKNAADVDHEVPVAGGADEPITPGAGESPASVDVVSEPVDPAPAAPVRPSLLAGTPGGTEFGTLVHHVLDGCDFTAPSLLDDLIERCSAALRYRSIRVDPIRLATGLTAAIEAPLGGPVGSMRLRDLATGDRLDELAFDLPLAQVGAAQIGAVLAAHLPGDDLLRPWAEAMARSGFEVDLAGMLTGSIDLVARSGDGTKFWVADYKTNQLGVDSTYSRADMAAAMAHHHYPLQAALYLVALHRYLRWRVRDYSPDTHLVGAAYLFVRGMGPTQPTEDVRGVFWWQPPAAAIMALDQLLATGAVR